MSHALSAHAAKKSAPVRVPPAGASQRGCTNHQFSMFEPHGEALSMLVVKHQADFFAELKRAENLRLSGLLAASNARFFMSAEAQEKLFICEMALQFEQLAGLA